MSKDNHLRLFLSAIPETLDMDVLRSQIYAAGLCRPVLQMMQRRVDGGNHDALRVSYASIARPSGSLDERPPVVMVGAGITGCALAHVLRSGNVPFEIHEKQSGQSPMTQRYQTRFYLDTKKLDPLCQHMGFSADDLHYLLNHRGTPRVRTHWFFEALREGLPIQYGHNLNVEPTRSLNDGKEWRPRFDNECVVHQSKASLVVGADGTFSDGLLLSRHAFRSS